MATPTFATIIPAVGHSGGKTLVEIVGTNFKLPPAPAPTGKTVAPGPSVRVLFDGVAATHVAVVSSTLLYCLSPKGDPGTADVRIDNLDTTGAPIAGENVTGAAAFTYQRPDLSEESELTRVMRALLRELKRQVIENVSWATHTDYDSTTGDTLNLAHVQTLPALVLANLELPENREHAVQEEQDYDAGGDRFISRRPPVCVNLQCDIIGVSDSSVEILNFMQVIRMFFKKNPYLELDRDASDPSLGTVKYEWDFVMGSSAAVAHADSGANVESFTGQMVVRGILLEDMPGISKTKPTGIPAKYPHEATTGFGYKSADADTGFVALQTTQKADDD